MFRMLKWLTPVVALGLMIAYQPSVRAEDAKSETGSVSGKVMGADGKAVADARVRVVKPDMKMDEKPKAKQEANEAGGKHKDHGMRQKAVAEGSSDKDGNFKLENIPAGDYVVMAMVKGVGAGREKVAVKAGETATVEITLKPMGEKKKEAISGNKL